MCVEIRERPWRPDQYVPPMLSFLFWLTHVYVCKVSFETLCVPPLSRIRRYLTRYPVIHLNLSVDLTYHGPPVLAKSSVRHRHNLWLDGPLERPTIRTPYHPLPISLSVITPPTGPL